MIRRKCMNLLNLRQGLTKYISNLKYRHDSNPLKIFLDLKVEMALAVSIEK